MCDLKAILTTEVLTCPICFNEFASKQYEPVSLCCGHTICRGCLKAAENRQCPFDQRVFNEEALNLPTNTAILRILHNNNNNNNNLTNGDDHAEHVEQHAAATITDACGSGGEEAAAAEADANGPQNPEEEQSYKEAMQYFESMALQVRSFLNDEYTGSALPRPMLRKIATLIKCQLMEEEGRLRAFRSVHSLAERAITDVILKYQDPTHLCTHLWTQVRARGCQFLGAQMQSDVLKSVLAALEDGAALARKTIVMMVLDSFKPNYPQTSKTSIGRVVQLLYRACCFKIVKRESESSLMELKEEFRSYEALRREHDKEIIRIAHEAGLFIPASQWSTLLYGDSLHIPYLQNVVNGLKTPLAFDRRIDGLQIAAQRIGNPNKFDNLRMHLKIISTVDACFETTAESNPPTWDDLNKALNAVLHILEDISDIMHVNANPYMLDYQGGSKRNLNTKYKISLCRDVLARRPCPRGKKCTFAHSQEEQGKYREQWNECRQLGGGPESCNTPIEHQMPMISPVESSSNSNIIHYNGEIIENPIPTTSRLTECMVSPSPPVLQAPPLQTLVSAQPNIDPANGNHDDDSDYSSDVPQPLYVNYAMHVPQTWEQIQQMEQGNFMGAQGMPPYIYPFHPEMYTYPYGNSNALQFIGHPNFGAPSFQIPIYHPPMWEQQHPQHPPQHPQHQHQPHQSQNQPPQQLAQESQQQQQQPPPPPPPQQQQPQPQQPQTQPQPPPPQPQPATQHPLQPTAPPFYPGKPFYSGHYNPAGAPGPAPVDGFIYGHPINEAGLIYAAAPNGRPHRGNFYPNFPYNGSKKANLSKANGY